MAEQLTRHQLAEIADILVAPPAPATPQHQVDRTFELPTRLYAVFAGLCLGFIAVTGIGFANPEMILPVAIFAVFIAGFFIVPAIWTRLAPEAPTKALSWGKFKSEGIQALTGHMTANEAMAQMLVLPVLLFVWGVVTVAIAAIVR